ncbi:MAG: hypothetical protein JSS21_12785 [Proteobacteria bacterium]|nr:hypothetical protein [Pseudomonadota bacterium]
MKTVSKRELNQQTARVLDRVRASEPLFVTERGVARWRIEAVDEARDPVVRMRLDGRIVPAKPEPRPWHAGRARYTPAEVEAIFAESRGEH